MSNLHKILSKLCEERKITPYRMCKDNGIQPSVMTDLKMGRRKTVKAETATRLANYFGVSVDYLLGNEENPPVQEVQGVDVKDALQQLEEILSADTALFDGTCLTEEDRLKAYGGIQFLKAQLAARAKNDKNKGNG